MNKADLMEVREFRPSDLNFVMSTWLKGLRYGNDTFGLIDSKVYFDAYHKIIEALINLPETMIVVACLKEDSEVILGYSVVNPTKNLVHFTFVKSAWRGIGIAKNLVSSDTTTATHVTKIGAAIIRKKKLTFNPFIS